LVELLEFARRVLGSVVATKLVDDDGRLLRLGLTGEATLETLDAVGDGVGEILRCFHDLDLDEIGEGVNDAGEIPPPPYERLGKRPAMSECMSSSGRVVVRTDQKASHPLCKM
jgi:hypothetical protein